MIKKVLYLLPIIILISCSNDDAGIEEISASINTSNDEPSYNDTYSITWESNASQCYAQSSTGSWIGEIPTSGSREFVAKRAGATNYSIECRTSINFANASVDINVQKEIEDYFDFTDAEKFDLGSFSAEDDNFYIRDVVIRDLNFDFFQDIILLAELQNKQTGESKNHFLTFYFKNLSDVTEEDPILFEDLNAEGRCSADKFIRFDLNQDQLVDILAVSNSPDQSLDKNGLCIFLINEDGAVLQDDSYLQNETSLDLSNVGVSTINVSDGNNDAILDLLLMGSGGSTDLPFYIQPSEDGPFISLPSPLNELNPYNRNQGCAENIEFLCQWISKEYEFKSSAAVNSDGNADLDLIFSIISNEGPVYSLYNSRIEETKFYDWSIPLEDFIMTSISTNDGFALRMSSLDANIDGYTDLFVLERSLESETKLSKLSVYEKIVSDESQTYSSTNNGDFPKEFDETESFENFLVFDVDNSGFQDIFISFDEFPYDPTNNLPNDKHFLLYEKIYEVDDDENVFQEWREKDFSDQVGLDPSSIANYWIDADLDGDLDVILVIPQTIDASQNINYKFTLYKNNSLE